MLKIIVSFFLLFTVIITTACPKKEALRKGEEAAFLLAGAINDTQTAVERAEDAAIITREMAREGYTLILRANQLSRTLTNTVERLRTTYGKMENVPAAERNNLTIITGELVEVILDINRIFKFANTPALETALRVVNELVLTISALVPKQTISMIELRESYYGG